MGKTSRGRSGTTGGGFSGYQQIGGHFKLAPGTRQNGAAKVESRGAMVLRVQRIQRIEK
jgi:hypothetical protein